MRYALPLTQVGEPTTKDLIDSNASGAAKKGRCPCCGHAVRLATSPYIMGYYYTHNMPNILCHYNGNTLHAEVDV